MHSLRARFCGKRGRWQPEIVWILSPGNLPDACWSNALLLPCPRKRICDSWRASVSANSFGAHWLSAQFSVALVCPLFPIFLAILGITQSVALSARHRLCLQLFPALVWLIRHFAASMARSSTSKPQRLMAFRTSSKTWPHSVLFYSFFLVQKSVK